MKQHTIIFVPHARAKFRKWRLSTLQAASLLGGLAFLTIGGVVATISYFGATVDRDQLVALQSENAALREINDGFDSSIRELEGTVEEYQGRIRDLAIVAGLSEPAPPEAGIGGGDPEHSGGDALAEDLLGIEAQLFQMGRGMDRVERKLNENSLLISTTPAISPVKGLLTSGYGYRADPFTGRRSFHHGIDIVAPRGQEIRATGNGLVTKAGRDPGLGNAVYVSHGFGIVTRYGHMSKINVRAGERIRRGDVIGHVGSSGRATGNHVHYEVHVDGHAEDPLGYILDGTRKRGW